MKEYLKNLWYAILGRNLCAEELIRITGELAQARREHEQTVCEVRAMQEQYGECCRHTEELSRELGTLRQLVENQRLRLAEKDILMDRIKQNYQKRISQYTREVDALKNDK